MTTAEMTADTKMVYNGTLTDLVSLAEKYNVTTKSLSYAKAYPSDVYASLAAQAFKTMSDQREIRSLLYATIKSQLRQAGTS